MPERDMTPQTLEEKIVCYADKFFSKVGDPLTEKPLGEVRSQIEAYGAEKLKIFDKWTSMFGEN
jgi:uncharacterized protein